MFGWGLVWSSVWGSIWGLVWGSVVVFGKGLEESYSFEFVSIASDANGLPGTLDTIPMLNTSVWKYLLAGRSMLVLGIYIDCLLEDALYTYPGWTPIALASWIKASFSISSSSLIEL